MNDTHSKAPIPGLVSVIVPLYNSASTIDRCINSILGQTYKPFEIIVVNDGSTDNGPDLVSGYPQKVTLLHLRNLGPAAARNYGIRESHGQFISFLDSDDYWLPNFLEESIAALNLSPPAIATSTATKAIHWTGKEIVIPDLDSTKMEEFKASEKLISDFFTFWAAEDHIRTGSVTINTDLLPHPLYQNEELRISEDLEYWGMLATYGKWKFLPEVLFVTDGTSNAASVGWFKKNKERRNLCPTVEQWQARLINRLKKEDQRGFSMLRGRIAGNFAHSKILAGEFLDARDIVKRYGDSFRDNFITRLMKRGANSSSISWYLICFMIQGREFLKSIYISFKFRFLSTK